MNTEGCARLERHDSGRRHTGDALCAINEKPQSNTTCDTANQVVQASSWRQTTRRSPKPLRCWKTTLQDWKCGVSARRCEARIIDRMRRSAHKVREVVRRRRCRRMMNSNRRRTALARLRTVHHQTRGKYRQAAQNNKCYVRSSWTRTLPRRASFGSDFARTFTGPCRARGRS